MYEVRALLKQFGTFIYTGDRSGDLDLMQDELIELFKAGLITTEQYKGALTVIHNEKRFIK